MSLIWVGFIFGISRGPKLGKDMKSKSFRGFKSNQPLFKVQVEKKDRSRRRATGETLKNSGYTERKCIEEQKVNVFMTASTVSKIPSPPTNFLKEIEKEKNKMGSDYLNEENALLTNPVYWGDCFFSIIDPSLNSLSTRVSRRSCSPKPLNSFMAFRAYYSQFGYGLKQNILSSLLATAWHSHPEQQKIWDTFAQQFNFVKPKCGFVEWVDQRYERESCI